MMLRGIKKAVQRWKDRNLFSLVNIKHAFGKSFGNTYYSQSGEDIIVAKLLRNVSHGFYVDVGAYHPLHYSNTYLLYLRGWQGIAVDPNPKTIALFKKRRPRDIALQCGIAETEHNADYHMFNHQSCNTFSQEHKRKMEREPHITYLGKENIRCVPLQKILQKHVPEGTALDLLSIDAEGMDVEVLRSNDWKKYPSRIVIVESENASLNHLETDPLYHFMKERGYTLHASTGLSLIFIHKDLKHHRDSS